MKFRKREAFIREFIPIFQSFYSFISQDRRRDCYTHARDASLLESAKESRVSDQIGGHSPMIRHSFPMGSCWNFSFSSRAQLRAAGDGPLA